MIQHIWVGPLAHLGIPGVAGVAAVVSLRSCGRLAQLTRLQDWSCLLLEAVVTVVVTATWRSGVFIWLDLVASFNWLSVQYSMSPTMSLKRLRQAKTYSDARCSVQKLGLTQMKINNCRQHARWWLHVSNTAELDALEINAWDTGRLRRVGSKMICFSSFTGGPPIIVVEQGGALCPWSVKTKKLNCVSFYVHIQYTQASVSIYI